MKTSEKQKLPNNWKQVGPLVSGFHKVRILNYISAGPLAAVEIGHLRRMGYNADGTSVNHLLARLARAGWIKAKRMASDQNSSPPWLITRTGRAALATSRQSLDNLHKTLSLKPQNSKRR